jgi:hypothetical protein
MNLLQKLLTCCSIFLLLPAFADAQHGFGLKLGPNMTTTYGASEDPPGKFETAKFRPGFQLGLVYNGYINDVFSIITEVNYEMRRSAKELNYVERIQVPQGQVNIYNKEEVTNTFGYLNVPFLAAFGPAWFKIYTGPNVAVLLHAKGEHSYTTEVSFPDGVDPSTVEDVPVSGEIIREVDYINDEPFSPSKPYIKRLELGANVGGRLFLSEHFFIDVCVHHSIFDITSDDYDIRGILPAEPTDENDLTFAFQWNVGWIF